MYQQPTMEYINTYHSENDEDEWDDISHLDVKYTKKNNIVSTLLQIAGGGSHAWWYVVEWDGVETDPKVFITTLYKDKESTNKTLIIRREQGGRCESVRLVDGDDDLPDDDDDYLYYKFHICDGIYDMEEEYEEEEEEEEEEDEEEEPLQTIKPPKVGPPPQSYFDRLERCRLERLEYEARANEPQYKRPCGECGHILCINTSIMCYSNGDEGDKTLCSSCYWDNDFWKDDENEDNMDDIKDYIYENRENLFCG